MQKGIYERTNKGLGFKLTNSTSFGESLISTGFIQKTIKGNLFVKRNQGIILWHLPRKVLEDYRRLSTEEGDQPPPCGAGRPHMHVAQPPVGLTHRHLLEYSFTIS
jgi:hypothetical protein